MKKMTDRNESFWLDVDDEIARAKEEIESFKELLDQNPCYAFRWSLETVEAAARLAVLTNIKLMHEDGCSIEEIKAKAHEQVFIGSRWPPESTSRMVELVATHLLSEWAHMHHRLSHFFDSAEDEFTKAIRR